MERIKGIVRKITQGDGYYVAEIDVHESSHISIRHLPEFTGTFSASLSIIEVGECVEIEGKITAGHMLVDKIIQNFKLRDAAVCILEVGAAILLLQRRNPLGKFCLPGGKVDPEDKTFADAVCREVEEETGVKIDKPIKIGEVLSTLDNFLVHVYYKKLDALPQVVLSDEHLGFMWTMNYCGSERGFEYAGNTWKMIDKMSNG